MARDLGVKKSSGDFFKECGDSSVGTFFWLNNLFRNGLMQKGSVLLPLAGIRLP
jgi:hypothetical protein